MGIKSGIDTVLIIHVLVRYNRVIEIRVIYFMMGYKFVKITI